MTYFGKRREFLLFELDAVQFRKIGNGAELVMPSLVDDRHCDNVEGGVTMISDFAKCDDSELRSCAFPYVAGDVPEAMTDDCREASWEAIARDGSRASLPAFLNPDSLPSPPTL